MIRRTVFERLRRRVIGRRLDSLLRAAGEVLHHCEGRRAFTGKLQWDASLGPQPDAVALTDEGIVVVIDVLPPRGRVRQVESWCAEVSTEHPWTLWYLPFSLRSLALGAQLPWGRRAGSI